MKLLPEVIEKNPGGASDDNFFVLEECVKGLKGFDDQSFI